MSVAPYLMFNGRCEEALDFYKQALGAEIGMMMRFKESPEKPSPGCAPADGDKIMHAAFKIGGTPLMASDGMERGGPKFEGFSLTLAVNNEAEANRMFDALSRGGEVRMPLDKTFFSPRFGVVADKFGMTWMVMIEP